MSNSIEKILLTGPLNKEEIVTLLSLQPQETNRLFRHALRVKSEFVGRKVYFRGLIEFSNRCSKNCYYCGIRHSNTRYQRYQVTNEEVLEAARYAHKHRFGSIVIQSGENASNQFVDTIEFLLQEIAKQTNKELHVTLSLGEQTEEVYRRWLEAGAQRYLLRIETSNRELYNKLHPPDKHHGYDQRMEALDTLRRVGYQVGTGVMIGLPFQTLDNLADDLLFYRHIDIDMVGMGPYIEHKETPLFQYRDKLPSLQERLELSLKMVAILRIMMKDVNIAATTAMQTIDSHGRERALLAGANVMMPNLTPIKYKQSYLLYNDKPGLEDDAEESSEVMEKNIRLAGDTIGYGEWGDSNHFVKRSEITK